MTDIINVFAEFEPETWPFQYRMTLHQDEILGGVPSDPNIAMAWLKSKVVKKDDRELETMVQEIMAERKISQDEALAEINTRKHLNGFRYDPLKGAYIGGYQLKAAIKEAISIAVAAPAPPGGEKKLDIRGWGDTKKFLTNYAPEHIHVEEVRLYLVNHATGKPFHEPTGVHQSFPKNQRINQTGIQYTEFCENVDITATITTDHPFTFKEFAVIWGTGAKNGLGAQRSQGHGRYTVTEWTQLRGPEVKKSARGVTKATAKKGDAKGDPEDEDSE